MAPAERYNISTAKAVARLFPKAAEVGISLEGMTPGRYWPAWEMPPDPTDLDLYVQKLLDRKIDPRFLSRADLSEMGIPCPYYAWRTHIVFAVNQANKTAKDLSFEKKSDLIKNIKLLEERIEINERLAQFDPELPIPRGSLYLNPGDLGKHGEDGGLAVHQAMIKFVEDINLENKRDINICSLMRDEVDRIDLILEGKSGAQINNSWVSPFLVYTGNLWALCTGRPPPSNDGPFRDLINVAFTVVSGKTSVEKWEQMITLKRRFKKEPSDRGFGLHQEEFLSLESEENVPKRGPALSNLMEIGSGTQDLDPFVEALAVGAIHLRDHAEGSLALIMREIILKREMTREDMLPSRAAIQLGWLSTPSFKELDQSIRSAVLASWMGDLAAISVIQVAYAYDDIREIIEKYGWPEPWLGHCEEEFIEDFQRRDELASSWENISGDHKAFAVAMMMFETRRRN